MQNSPILAVRGEVALEVEPEVARIEVSVAAREPDRPRALRALTKRETSVTKILGAYSEIIEKSEASGVRLSPQRVGGPDAKAGYHGVIHR
jgi:uncharacterized protein